MSSVTAAQVVNVCQRTLYASLGGNCTLRTHAPQTVPLLTKSAVTAAAAADFSFPFVFRWSNLSAQPDETIVGNKICKRAYCWFAPDEDNVCAGAESENAESL